MDRAPGSRIPPLRAASIPRGTRVRSAVMAPPQRPKPRTPAERAEELAAVQRRLKREAAERRERDAVAPDGRAARALSAHGHSAARRRTP
jgi:hypothetical protein